MSDIESKRLRRRKVLKGVALRAGRGALPRRSPGRSAPRAGASPTWRRP